MGSERYENYPHDSQSKKAIFAIFNEDSRDEARIKLTKLKL